MFHWVLLGIPATLKQPTLRATVAQKGYQRDCEGVSDLIQHSVNKAEGVMASHRAQQLYLIDEISDQGYKLTD